MMGSVSSLETPDLPPLRSGDSPANVSVSYISLSPFESQCLRKDLHCHSPQGGSVLEPHLPCRLRQAVLWGGTSPRTPCRQRPRPACSLMSSRCLWGPKGLSDSLQDWRKLVTEVVAEPRLSLCLSFGEVAPRGRWVDRLTTIDD